MSVKIDGGGYINSPYLGTANNIYTDGTGKVGIGTSTPTNLLEVAGSAANIYLRSNDTGDATLRYMGASSERATVRASSGNALYMETGGVERFRIDSSGRITIPYQPAFRAYLTTSQTYSAAGTVIFNSAAVNRGSIYNTSNGRFTAPVSGVYFISHFITFQLNSAANQRGCDSALYLNGSFLDGAAARNGAYAFTSGYYAGTGNSIVVSLSAGDYLEVRGSVFDNSANYFFSDESTFSGFLIG